MLGSQPCIPRGQVGCAKETLALPPGELPVHQGEHKTASASVRPNGAAIALISREKKAKRVYLNAVLTACSFGSEVQSVRPVFMPHF